MSRIIKVITEEENIQPPYLYIVKKKKLQNTSIKNIILGKKDWQRKITSRHKTVSAAYHYKCKNGDSALPRTRPGNNLTNDIVPKKKPID